MTSISVPTLRNPAQSGNAWFCFCLKGLVENCIFCLGHLVYAAFLPTTVSLFNVMYHFRVQSCFTWPLLHAPGQVFHGFAQAWHPADETDRPGILKGQVLANHPQNLVLRCYSCRKKRKQDFDALLYFTQWGFHWGICQCHI